jgi:hypothetical protein
MSPFEIAFACQQECAMNGTNAGSNATKTRADSQALQLIPILKAATASGLKGLAELAAHLNTQNIPTPRGRLWQPESVRGLLHRLTALGHSEFKVRSRTAASYDRSWARQAREAAARAKNAARRQELIAAGVIKGV